MRKNNLSIFVILLFMTFNSLIFLSCEKDLLPSQNQLISESKEFEEYVAIHYKFFSEVNSFKSQNQKIGQINGRNIYRKVSKSFDPNLFLKTIEARNSLLEKYPEYSQMAKNDKNDILEKALSTSTKLNQIIPLELLTPQIRLKGGNSEGDDALGLLGFFTQFFGSYDDAYDACRNYSQTNNVESGGYIFPNGTALFVVDSLATDTTMNIPIWNGIGASATFHFHPGDDAAPWMSPTDSMAMETISQYGVDSVIIITNDTIQGYGF